MDSENITTAPKKQRRNTKKSPLSFIIVFCSVLLVCLLIFLYLKSEDIIESNPGNQSGFINDATTLPLPPIFKKTTDSLSKSKIKPQNNDISSIRNDSDLTSSVKKSAETKGASSLEPSLTFKGNICDQSYDVVQKFLLHLDNQDYIKQYTAGTESEIYFIELIQKLGDNPPVVSRETDDLFTILKNTAHFFRIIGKDNILALKGILANEKSQFEIVLSHFYKLTQSENCLNEKLRLNLSKDVLYDYAGFFLNTMGGRLYLFRRDSVSRLTVSYYSILLIEQANRQGRNTHGLDIRPAVELLIPEIENSGTQLRLKDIYLEKLYELENRMN